MAKMRVNVLNPTIGLIGFIAHIAFSTVTFYNVFLSAGRATLGYGTC